MTDKNSTVNVMVNFQPEAATPWKYTPDSPIVVKKSVKAVTFTLDDATAKTYRYVGVARGDASGQVSQMSITDTMITISDKNTMPGAGIPIYLTVASGGGEVPFITYTSPDPQIINED